MLKKGRRDWETNCLNKTTENKNNGILCSSQLKRKRIHSYKDALKRSKHMCKDLLIPMNNMNA